MTDFRDEGRRVLREMLPDSFDAVEKSIGDGSFGDELLEIGVENIFGRLWSREGLSRRDRSLVTMGILIALRATDEFKAHVQIARTNGLSEDEIAEVISHASGYAGLPNANTALNVAREALSGDGRAEQ